MRLNAADSTKRWYAPTSLAFASAYMRTVEYAVDVMNINTIRMWRIDIDRVG